MDKKIKCRLGQVWQKRDIKTLWQLTGRRHGKWAMKKLGGGAGKPHAIEEHDLFKYYELFTANNAKETNWAKK